MSSYDAKKVEEYQLILLKNPGSKVFAALAEVYRKMGLHNEALETTHRGLQRNPDYVSGLVAQARTLYDMNLFAEAIPSLQKALAQKPENLLALRLLAHCHIKLKQQKPALQAYKKLLFYNPNDEKAALFIKRWEFIEASEFAVIEPLIANHEVTAWVESLPTVGEFLPVVDTYLQKGNLQVATYLLRAGHQRWPNNEDIGKRQKLAHEKAPTDPVTEVSRNFWQNILQRVEQRKNIDPFR